MTFPAPAGRIDGEHLVIADRTALPQRCMLTNESVSDIDYTHWDVPYIRSILVLLIFGPLVLLFAPFMARKRCRIKAGLARSIRRRYQCARVALILLGVLPFLVVVSAFVIDAPLLMLAGLGFSVPAIYIAAIAHSFCASPVKIVKVDKDLFWLKGCSKEFLASLEAEQQ